VNFINELIIIKYEKINAGKYLINLLILSIAAEYY
jgi:hypothetical protein